MKHNYIIALLIAFCMSFTTQTEAQTPSLREFTSTTSPQFLGIRF
ncbi:MAG: hypothetical protein U0X76_07840 [Bacteroidia bacterium]